MEASGGGGVLIAGIGTSEDIPGGKAKWREGEREEGREWMKRR
jgi:hypothetical protein